MRSKFTRDSSSCASAAASCACSCRVSSSHEHVALLDGLARFERDAIDDAGRSALTVTPCTAATVPIASERRRPFLLRGDDGRHRFGRRLHRGELRRHRLELSELYERQARR